MVLVCKLGVFKWHRFCCQGHLCLLDVHLKVQISCSIYVAALRRCDIRLVTQLMNMLGCLVLQIAFVNTV